MQQPTYSRKQTITVLINKIQKKLSLIKKKQIIKMLSQTLGLINGVK